MASVNITAGVGLAGTNNEKDAVAVKQRLVNLGFSWLASNLGVDPKVRPETIRAIQLFQGIETASTSCPRAEARRAHPTAWGHASVASSGECSALAQDARRIRKRGLRQ